MQMASAQSRTESGRRSGNSLVRRLGTSRSAHFKACCDRNGDAVYDNVSCVAGIAPDIRERCVRRLVFEGNPVQLDLNGLRGLVALQNPEKAYFRGSGI